MQIYKYLLFLVVLASCQTPEISRFSKLKSPTDQSSNLYIIRSINPILSLWDYKIHLYKVPNFKEKENRIWIRSISISMGEYCVWNLEKGNYLLTLSNDTLEKVIYLNQSESKFVNLEIFSTGFFQFPEFYLKEYSREDGLRLLLEDQHLKKCSSSED